MFFFYKHRETIAHLLPLKTTDSSVWPTTHYLNKQLLSNLTLIEKRGFRHYYSVCTYSYIHISTEQWLCRPLWGWRVTVRNCRPGLTRSGERHTEAPLSKLLWRCCLNPLSHFPIHAKVTLFASFSVTVLRFIFISSSFSTSHLHVSLITCTFSSMPTVGRPASELPSWMCTPGLEKQVGRPVNARPCPPFILSNLPPTSPFEGPLS